MRSSFDTIVVGAGAAGCVLVNRLTEDPSRSVLLIEAGPDFPTVASLPDEIRLAYTSPSGQIARSYDWAYPAKLGSRTDWILRGKVVGGSSAVNAQIYLRALPYDFDHWAQLGNETWSWAKVEPYFSMIENDLDFGLGHQGQVPVRRFTSDQWADLHIAFFRSCREHGYPACPNFNAPYATGVGPIPMNNANGMRHSAAICYLYPIRSRSNLTIFSEALTHRIRFEGKRALGVDFETQNGNYDTAFADQVILAAGAIGTPLILQRSGIGRASELESIGIAVVADLPGVGRNLRDHPTVRSIWHTNNPGPSASHLHKVGLRYTATGSPDTDDMMILAARGKSSRCVLTATLMLAHSEGFVRIRSLDPYVDPEINYCLLERESDRMRMREGILLCRQLAEHKEVSRHLKNPVDPADTCFTEQGQLDVWMMENVSTAHHVSCTCRMGSSSDANAVVDERGHVHGIEGLRVIDASIMPDCVRANIHSTVLMMAERLSGV